MQSTTNSDFPTDRNALLLYGFSAARSALFLLAVLVPYLEDHVGLTFREILLTEAAFAATMVLAEVPSGWIADQWQRKSALVIGTILWAMGILLLWTAGGFGQVVASQIAMGLAVSMHSGADSALLYDSLLCREQQTRYLNVESRRHGLSLGSLAVASAVAGPLYVWHPQSIFAFSFASIVLCGVFAILLHEPPRQRSHRGRFNFAAMIIVVTTICRANPIVLWTILFAAGLMATTKAAVWVQQAYLRLLEIDLIWFGPIAATGFLVGGIASQFGPLVDRVIGPQKTLGITAALVVLGFAIGGAFPSLEMIPLLFVGAAAYGIANPALKALLNSQVESDHRATILSVFGLARQLTFIVLSHFVGQVVDNHGAGDGFVFMALLPPSRRGAVGLA